MKVIIGADLNGEKVAQYITRQLKDDGEEIVSIVAKDENETYPVIAEKVCKFIQGKKDVLGVLVCGTGMGMVITANKFKGIYAATCYDEYSLERAVASNNINVLCLGQKVVGFETAFGIVRRWIELKRELKLNSSSKTKLEYICKIENENFK